MGRHRLAWQVVRSEVELGFSEHIARSPPPLHQMSAIAQEMPKLLQQVEFGNSPMALVLEHANKLTVHHPKLVTVLTRISKQPVNCQQYPWQPIMERLQGQCFSAPANSVPARRLLESLFLRGLTIDKVLKIAASYSWPHLQY